MDKCADLVTLLDIDHVLQRTALGLAVALWQLVYLGPIEATLLGEEHHGRVHIRLVYILDEVLIACCTGLSTYATTTLLTEVSQWSTFDISKVRDGDHHIVVGIHILRIELGSHLDDAGATLVGVLLLDFHKFVLNDLVAQSLASKQRVVVLDELL